MMELNGLLGLLQDEPASQASLFGAPSAPYQSYITALHPLQEMGFQQWVKQNGIPFDPSPTADYDMRGFYKAAVLDKDPRFSTAINRNDNQIHYPDHFKTPYHESFSNESRWALPGAPRWNEHDQLEAPSGKVVFDERKPRGLLGR